jgi:4-amino-4-deoxy-L-arabinose transferase-like glycosyltransferase
MAADVSPIPGLIIIVVCIALYFLPTIVAASRHKRSENAIVALNLLLGWTLIGWVVALVWALSADPPDPVVVAAPPRRRLPPILCATCGKYSTPGSQFCSSCGGRFLTP